MQDEVLARCLREDPVKDGCENSSGLDLVVTVHRLCNLACFSSIRDVCPDLSMATTATVWHILHFLADLPVSENLIETLREMDSVVRNASAETEALCALLFRGREVPAYQAVGRFLAQCISDGKVGTIRMLLTRAEVLGEVIPSVRFPEAVLKVLGDTEIGDTLREIIWEHVRLGNAAALDAYCELFR
jgi:hypothetical protein